MLMQIEEAWGKEVRGLCGSCRHAPGCLYLKTTDSIVVQCEVFESAEAKDPFPLEGKGLCANCFKNTVCRLSRASSGVWHCEEYE